MDFATLLEPLATAGPLVYFCYRLADQRVLYVSANYGRVLGGNVATVNEELPAWLAALHPDDRAYLNERLTYAELGEVQEILLRQTTPGGGRRWLWFTATRFEPAGSKELHISGHVANVTAEQEGIENANRFQAKKDAMLEILSHDLAGPLVTAEQLTSYLSERIAVLQDPQLLRMLGSLRQACQQGVSLIRDFVDQEFLESAEVVLKLSRVDLVRRLADVVDTYRERQGAAGHEFVFEASHPSIYADVDDNKLLQVINNLLGNAIKFTPDEGRLRVALHQHPEHLLLTVADNGIGIPAGLQPLLFERFTRAGRVGLRGEKSTGLGMSISRNIVQLHRGRIWVESQEGVGTTFYIELPRPEGT